MVIYNEGSYSNIQISRVQALPDAIIFFYNNQRANPVRRFCLFDNNIHLFQKVTSIYALYEK